MPTNLAARCSAHEHDDHACTPRESRVTLRGRAERESGTERSLDNEPVARAEADDLSMAA